MPFVDEAFDIAVSNAVLEHVGSRAAQVGFVRELRRVARKAFITVPNRYFPVEHHTGLPFVHFRDATFARFRACNLTGKNKWATSTELILMSKSNLRSFAPDGSKPTIGYTGLLLGPFSSNLYLSLQ